MLAPLKAEWPSIDGARKRKWLDIADRYSSLPAGEQQRVAARMAEWARLSPEERARARLSFQEATQLSPQERQARWEKYQALPESERKALAARAVPSAPGAAHPRPAVASAPSVRPVAPTIVQVQPGATTTLMSHQPKRPSPVAAGAPKISARPSQVDPVTLLPQTGPQAAGRPGAASAAK